MNKVEESHCRAFHNWLTLKGLKHTHIVNEVGGAVTNRQRAMREGARLKRMGKSSGVPDYVVLTPQATVWIEMKRPDLKPKNGDWTDEWTPEAKSKAGVKRDQKEWLDAINNTPGSEAFVAYSSLEAIEYVSQFL